MNLLLSCRKRERTSKEENCFTHRALKTGEPTSAFKGTGGGGGGGGGSFY